MPQFRLKTVLLLIGVLSIWLGMTRCFGGRIGFVAMGVGIMLLAAGEIRRQPFAAGRSLLACFLGALIGQMTAMLTAAIVMFIGAFWLSTEGSLHPLLAGMLAWILVGGDCVLVLYPLALIAWLCIFASRRLFAAKSDVAPLSKPFSPQ